MSSLYIGGELNIIKFLEYEILSRHYSLNSCNITVNHFFYFNIVSYIFILLFSFAFILLGFMWGRGKEDIFLWGKFIYYQNLIAYYRAQGCSTNDVDHLIWILKRTYKEMYEKELDESLDIVGDSIFWWEPWSYEILAFFPPFNKKFFNSPWHFYYKYRLSSWIRWHILEDRICIFVLFFLWILV